jgi:hypothetical protein
MRVYLIAHSAWMMGDAILRTLYRLFVSRRHMLEWRTASQVARTLRVDVAAHYRFMWASPAIAAAAIAMPLLSGSSGIYVAAIFAFFWTTAPAFAWFVSRSAAAEDGLTFTERERLELRDVARRTWLYFEEFVTAEHNMLPPDNFQESPAQIVAPRTSPTNIGMYLLSVVASRDFGWIGLSDTVERIAATLSTVEKLERYRGHLYNWYDTRRLAPLEPLYVSSVDSGNLAANTYTTGNVELAAVWGPFSVQSELFLSNVNLSNGDSVNAYGAYVYGSFFLTGEQRSYERFGQHGAQFNRNKPDTNFSLVPGCYGWGAWEAKIRTSYLGLKELDSGQYNDLTVGFNWYWSDRIRVMFDWIHPVTSAQTVFGATHSDLIGTRFDFNW